MAIAIRGLQIKPQYESLIGVSISNGLEQMTNP